MYLHQWPSRVDLLIATPHISPHHNYDTSHMFIAIATRAVLLLKTDSHDRYSSDLHCDVDVGLYHPADCSVRHEDGIDDGLPTAIRHSSPCYPGNGVRHSGCLVNFRSVDNGCFPAGLLLYGTATHAHVVNDFPVLKHDLND